MPSPLVDTNSDTTSTENESEPLEQKSPASSEQSQKEQNGEENGRPAGASKNISPNEKLVASDFAQTRSLPPAVESDQPSNRPSPSDKNPNEAPTSPPDLSPFSKDFFSANSDSSFFSNRKATPVLRLRVTSGDNVKKKGNVGQPSSNSNSEVNAGEVNMRTGLVTDNIPQVFMRQETVEEEAVEEEAPTHQEISQEDPNTQASPAEAPKETQVDEDVTKLSRRTPDTSASLDATEDQLAPNILSFLEGVVDQQFDDGMHYLTESTDADQSSSMTSTVPFLPPLEEPRSPQTSWGVHTCQALEEPRWSVPNFDMRSLHPLSNEVTRSPPIEKFVEQIRIDNAHEGRVHQPHADTKPLNLPSNDSYDLRDPSMGDHNALRAASFQQSDNWQSSSSRAPRTPKQRCLSQTKPDELINSSDAPEDLDVRLTDNLSIPTQPIIFISRYHHWPPQLQAQDSITTENDPWQDTPQKSSTKSSLIGSDDAKCTYLSSPSSEQSSLAEPSSAKSEIRVKPTSEDEQVFMYDSRGTRLAQFHRALNQELCGFKNDFLQQLNSILSESTSQWIPARNSIAASMLSRPSIDKALGLMENSIKVDISDKYTEILSKIDVSKTEVIGDTARGTKSLQKQLTDLSNNLQNTITKHIDQQLCGLQRSLASSTTVHLDTPVPKKVEFELPGNDRRAAKGFSAHTDISSLIESLKSLVVASNNEVSEKLDRSIAYAKNEQNKNVAVVGAMQKDIVENLQQIAIQSTLQNNAINDLVNIINSLHDVIRGISHDTTLIDGTLTRNAAVLTTVTEQAEKLERTAGSFDKIIDGAEFASKMANADMLNQFMARVKSIAANAKNTTDTALRVEALQDQMTVMQAQLGQVLEVLNTRQPAENVSVGGRQLRSQSRCTTENRHNGSRSRSATSSISSDLVNHLNDSPTIATRTIFKSHDHKQSQLVYPAHLRLYEIKSVAKLIFKAQPVWKRHLARQGVLDAAMELITIRVPSLASLSGWQLIDNDAAYTVWYEAARSGNVLGDEPLLEIELMAQGKDNRSELEEPRTKKRKQDQMSRDSGSRVDFELNVWNAMSQAKR